MIATCELCKKHRPEAEPFKVPWGDHIGPALMKAHLAEHKKRGEA